MIIISVLFIIIMAILLYWKIPYSPEKVKFQKAMQKRLSGRKAKNTFCSREEIDKLPKPVRKYCEYIGLENFPKYQAVNVFFQDTDFVFDTKSGKKLKMDYDLWLFYGDIYRSAFCSSSMYGIPFEGVDYMTDDREGGMKGFLAKAIPLFDVRVEQGYRAGLISWLVESAVLNPSALLSDAVTYEEIDDTHVKATVTYNGVSGSGIFTFREDGALTEFYSKERQIEEIDGVRMELLWKCICEDYQEKNGIRMAGKLKSIKVFPDGKELVYFAADNYTISYPEPLLIKK